MLSDTTSACTLPQAQAAAGVYMVEVGQACDVYTPEPHNITIAGTFLFVDGSSEVWPDVSLC
jgi:hypothetical protein